MHSGGLAAACRHRRCSRRSHLSGRSPARRLSHRPPTPPPPPTSCAARCCCRPPQAPPAGAASLAALREEGNTLFAKREYERALEAYDRALKVAGGDSADAALLHSNKAACHMMHKKWVESYFDEGGGVVLCVVRCGDNFLWCDARRKGVGEGVECWCAMCGGWGKRESRMVCWR